MKYLVFLFFFCSMPIWGFLINHNLSSIFSTTTAQQTCQQKLQERIKELVDNYQQRDQIEQLLAHHANLAYQRLSYTFLRLKEQNATQEPSNQAFAQLKDLFDSEEKASAVIQALNEFNTYVYEQQNTLETQKIKDQFDNIFEGLIEFSKKYHSDPAQSHLVIQPSDKNLLYNLLIQGDNSFFEHFAQSVSQNLKDRTPSVAKDATAQADSIELIYSQFRQVPNDKINDFIKYMKTELQKFADDEQFAAECKNFLNQLIQSSSDRVNCVDCEEFRSILNPQNKNLLGEIFSILNHQYPTAAPTLQLAPKEPQNPCEEIKMILISNPSDGGATLLKDLGPEKIKEYVSKNLNVTNYSGFTNTDQILEKCFALQNAPATPPSEPESSPCESVQELLDTFRDEQPLERRISRCDDKMKKLKEEYPNCSLECKELTCDDYQKYFKENYIYVGEEEELSGEKCKDAIAEIKNDFEDDSLAQDCEYSCKKDDEEDSKSKKKEKFEYKGIPDYMFQNMMMQAPIPVRTKRIRKGGG